MAQLIFRAAARRDIAELAAFIETKSQSREVAVAFVGRLLAYCRHLSGLPGLLGRPRPELGDYRSVPFENYVIFFRYADEAAPRSHFCIIRVLHRARDVDAAFSSHRKRE